MPYALIRDGVVIDTADSIPDGSLQEPRGAKPYWLPLVANNVDHDADMEVLDVAVNIGAKQATMTHTKRERTAAELDELRAPAMARIEREYRSRVTHSRLVLATLAQCGATVPNPGAREETLNAMRKTKRDEVAKLATVSALQDYDASTGWD